MTTGIRPEDRAKAIGLGVALVVMLGFIGKTLVGIAGGQKPATAAFAPPPAAPGAAAATAAPGLEPGSVPPPKGYAQMIGNPFKRVLPNGATRALPPPPPPAPTNMAGGLPAAVRSMPSMGFQAPAVINPGAALPLTPPAPPEDPIKVEGVMIDRERTAIITVKDRTDYLSVGQSRNGYRVISIGNNDVTFEKDGEKVKVFVGETTKPQEPPLRSSSSTGSSLALQATN
jgi:hypothetical protein